MTKAERFSNEEKAAIKKLQEAIDGLPKTVGFEQDGDTISVVKIVNREKTEAGWIRVTFGQILNLKRFRWATD